MCTGTQDGIELDNEFNSIDNLNRTFSDRIRHCAYLFVCKYVIYMNMNLYALCILMGKITQA